MSQMIRDLMSTNVVSVSPQQSIQEAAALMDQNDIGSIPVVENGQVRGILTEV
jgi:CBS domain-containing protein